MAFPNEHPSYVTRRLEARMHKLNDLKKRLGETDSADPEAMKLLLIEVVDQMKEVTFATGIPSGRVGRGGN